MRELKFIVGPENKDIRIDKCITLMLGEEYSRTYVKHLIDNCLVQVNGRDIKPRYVTREGDDVFVRVPPEERSGEGINGENIPLDIIYEDDWIIVVDKPAGMVVHPGAGNKSGTLVNALMYHCKELPDAGNGIRPGIVHRLDKDTSGIVVVAKNDKALRSLSRQFQKRAVKKRYMALVSGKVEFDNGVIEVPIARHAVNRQKMDVSHETGKPARTIYHVKKRYDGFTALWVELETGRTHQIRVHMKHIGHPILGDRTYGKENGIGRQALHAEMIAFTHPYTGKHMEFHSPIPDDIMKIIGDGVVEK